MQVTTTHERVAEQHAAEQITLAKQGATASAERTPGAWQTLPADVLPMGHEVTLIPRAGQAGYVPVTDLQWLQEAREHHERLARLLAVAVRVPDSVRRDHAGRVAEWRGQVRAAGRDDTEPPAWTARVTDAWLAGRLDAAETAIVEVIDDMLAILRDAHVACEERGLDEELLASDDGFGGALVRSEHELHDRELPPNLPAWAGSARSWRAGRHADMKNLETYKCGHEPREGK